MINTLEVGSKYLGELLIVDFEMNGLKEDSWYEVLKNGEVREADKQTTHTQETV